MNNLFNQTSLSSSQVQEYLSFLSHNLRQSPLAKEQFQNLFALQNFHSPMFLSPYIPQRQGKTLQLTEDMSTPDSAFSSKEDAFQSNLLNSQAKALKFEEDALSFENLIKKEDGSELSYSSDSKTQIEEMVKYFIQEFDNNDQHKSEYQRRRYASNASLLKLFDSLREKYSSASKCREDMLRLALRKALTFLRDSLRKQLNISAKAASSELCKKYSVGRLTTCSNEEEIMDQLLPYKKNSKYSTPNLCFVQEIFASEAFAEDYVKYLSKIDQILETDNDKKIPKFVDFLVGCVEKNTLNKVKTFKRLPWLKTWLKATKIIAVELLETNTGISYQDGQSAKGRESEPKVRPRQFF